ncbi:MAG: flagellar protein FlgN [Phycisphaerales bacterium]|nr:flagellar protein FlgN [Phycisphaerales bacterium]
MNGNEGIPSPDELISLLEQLIALQEALQVVIREKLEAMRRSDMDGMISAAHREGELAARVSVLDECRKRVAAELCRTKGLPKSARVEHVTLNILVERLGNPHRARLLELGNTLRVQMLKVAELNRVVELVSHEMLAHFKNLFSAFTQSEDGPRTYSRGGAVEAGSGANVLDAVG